MEIIGRDKISQSGDKSKLKIDNQQNKKSSLIKALIVAIIGGLIVSGIVYWIGWN